MTTEQFFETGAKSHEINDLILFLDNTQNLAKLRDRKFKFIKELRGEPKEEDFNNLLKLAIKRYKKEMPTSCKHLEALTEEQKRDFCRLYCEDFKQWEIKN